MRSAWRIVADNLPLGVPGVTPRTGRRVVAREFERGPETRPVPLGAAGLPGFNAQLGSPDGAGAPDWTAARSETPSPAAATPTTGAPDWWSR